MPRSCPRWPRGLRRSFNKVATWQALLSQSPIDRRESEMLAGAVLGRDRAWLLAHDDDIATPDAEAQFRSWIRRRSSGEPIPYVTGHKEFFGLDIEVTPSVLIPRPETEFVVERFLAIESSLPPGPVVDVGTGSGCILAAALSHSNRFGIGVESEREALTVAVRNWSRLDIRARPVLGDLLTGFRPNSVAAVLSNPPYIAGNDPNLDPAVAEFEPSRALFAGADGMDVVRQLAQQSSSILLPGGVLVMEFGFGQKAEVVRCLAGWDQVTVTNDLAGIPRVVVAHRP
jgi:release factor glutamine methyltransferase